ncbi:MAG: MG2 domain-containing protein, partial [Planctomycetota bacterium]|nr:MG2 domain-containing protein [Planctomycetota bacterium]
MLRSWILATLALTAWAAALAAPAAADELGLVVERTTPTQKTVPVVVRSDRQRRIEVRAYRVGNPDALLAAGVDLTNGRALVAYGTGADADKARKADAQVAAHYEMAALELVAKRRIDYRTRNAPHLEMIRFEQPGLYLLEARSRRAVARATAVVSDLALVVKRAPETTLVWALNRRTGKPWPGTVLRTGNALAEAGTTGADGVARIDAKGKPTLALVATSGDHLAFGEETYFPTIARDRRVYAFPHQPAYRPGERVELYGIVRGYEEGAYRIDRSLTQVTLRVLDSRSNVAFEEAVPVTADLGTFRGGFDLDAKAVTGDWTIEVAIGDDTYEAPLRVAAYRKPAFEVKVAPATPRVLAGEPAAFDVRASFYDGGVVAGAKVTWQLVYNRVDRELFPTDELVKLFFGAEREAYKPETLTTGEGVLDARGTLSVPVTAPPAKLDGYLTLRATVFGPDRIAVAGSGGLSIAAAPVRVDLKTDKHLYGPEDEALVTIQVETADGRPAQAREGVFTLAHVIETAANEATETWSKPESFTTDERGQARLRMTLPREGRFRFMAVVPRTDAEPAGSPAQAHVHAWALSDKPTLASNPGPLDVVADKDHYAVGDTARLFVRAPGSGRSVLAALEGATLLRHEVLDDAAIWTVRIDETHAPNVFATFATVYRGELMLETRMLRVPPVRSLLTATITPDHAELEPGAKTGATIRITDHAGNPVANAELAVAFVDAALHGLYADPAAPIEPFFHSLRRNNVKTAALLHHDSVDWVRVAGPVKKSRWDGADPAAAPPAPSEAAPTAPATPGASCGSAADAESEPMTGAERPEDSGAEGVAEDVDAEDAFEGPSFGDVPMRRAPRKAERRAGAQPLTVRKDFRSCVHWSANLRTDANGEARIDDVKVADSLTRWRISVRTVDASTRVGSGTATFLARKKIAVDAAPPRFLRAGDRVEIPVLLRNLTKEVVEATLQWWTPLHDPRLPLEQVPLGPANGPSNRFGVKLAAGATERRIVPLSSPGVAWASIEATVTSDVGGDKVLRTFPVLPQGIEKIVGRVIPTTDGKGAAELRIPETATPGSIRCRISLEASSVQAVVAALPYLLDYPHGCTEQTMNRFGPLADVAVAMKTLGVPVRGRLAELEAMRAAGLARLAQLQHDDGGFGWWESDASSPVMTALVVRGLTGLTGDTVVRMRGR